MWVVLLGIMRLGLNGGDILARASYPIDWGFAWVSENILAVALLILGIALIRILKMLFALQWITMLRTIIVFVALFASLSYVSDKSYQALVEYPSGSVEDQQGRLNAVGTMPWAADRLTSMASAILSPMSNQIVGATSDGVIGAQRDTAVGEQSSAERGISNVAGANAANPFGSEGPDPTCSAYISAIQSAYAESPNANNTLVVVSNLWLASFYSNWTAIQYGAPLSNQDNLPERAMCHYAEIVNETPSTEQASIVRRAYPGININSDSQVLAMPPGDADNQRRQVTAWVACSWNGSQWVTNPEFDGVWGQRISDNDGQGAFNGDRSCQNMFTVNKDDAPWFEGWEFSIGVPNTRIEVASVGSIAPQDDPYLIYGDRIVQALGAPSEGGVEASESMEDFDRSQLQAVNAWAAGASGLNYGDRILYPIVTAIVAALFLFSFGAMALGLLFAQLLMIVCLMFAVPAATVMYALGLPRAAQLLKLTVSSTFSQILFTAFLSLLILITGLFQAVLSALPLPGIMGTFVFGLAPLVAFYIMRSMLKRLGMGDMLSASGALSFASTATLRATGDKQLAAMATAPPGGKSAVQNGLSKVPFLGKRIDRFDKSLAPTGENWGPRLSMSTEARRARDQKRKQKRRGSTEKQQQARAKNEFLREQIQNRSHLPKFLRFRNVIDSALLRDHKGRNQRVGVAIDFLGHTTKSGALNAAAWGLWAAGAGFMDDDRRDALRDRVRKSSRSASWDANVKPLDENFEDDGTLELLPQAHRGGADAGTLLERVGQEFTRGLDQLSADGKLSGAVAEELKGAAAGFIGLDGPSLLTPDQEESLARQYSEMTGYPVEMLAMTPTGIVGPMGMTPEQLRNAPIEFLRDFEHHLPLEERLMQEGESPALYRARMEIIGRARGAILPDGSRIDILEANGIDINDPSTREEYARFQNGDTSTRFSRIELLQVSNSETRAVEIAKELMREISNQQISMISAALETTAKTIGMSVAGLGDSFKGLENIAEKIEDGFSRIGDQARQLNEARMRGDERMASRLAHTVSEAQYDQQERITKGQAHLAEVLKNSFETLSAGLAASGMSRAETERLLEDTSGRFTEIFDKYQDLATKGAEGTLSPEQLTAEVAALLARVSEETANARSYAESALTAAKEDLAQRSRMRDLRNRKPNRRTDAPSWKEHSDPRIDSVSAFGYDVPIFTSP